MREEKSTEVTFMKNHERYFQKYAIVMKEDM